MPDSRQSCAALSVDAERAAFIVSQFAASASSHEVRSVHVRHELFAAEQYVGDACRGSSVQAAPTSATHANATPTAARAKVSELTPHT
jgi:hypothetical protein